MNDSKLSHAIGSRSAMFGTSGCFVLFSSKHEQRQITLNRRRTGQRGIRFQPDSHPTIALPSPCVCSSSLCLSLSVSLRWRLAWFVCFLKAASTPLTQDRTVRGEGKGSSSPAASTASGLSTQGSQLSGRGFLICSELFDHHHLVLPVVHTHDFRSVEPMSLPRLLHLLLLLMKLLLLHHVHVQIPFRPQIRG